MSTSSLARGAGEGIVRHRKAGRVAGVGMVDGMVLLPEAVESISAARCRKNEGRNGVSDQGVLHSQDAHVIGPCHTV